ncbi:MAG TPA: PqqD family protein [Acidimicrobiales bacterium]|nr:PqqD family protein [Acidimicrobiales bacterium]
MASFRRAEGILSEVLDGKAALVNPEGTELVTLNQVGSVVWEALDGERDLDALVRAVTAACESAEPDVVTADVSRFLDEMCGLGLVVRM